mmetsp:Transcript_7614/g.18012  ORF Transcript_7614/g.18012 Transcript_7614/m.18012 type:complete len:549 (-) Transcript_7614:171-1817(-)
MRVLFATLIAHVATFGLRSNIDSIAHGVLRALHVPSVEESERETVDGVGLPTNTNATEIHPAVVSECRSGPGCILGFETYDAKVRRWEEEHDGSKFIGKNCTPARQRLDCGEAYACVKGECSPCDGSRQCLEKFKCVDGHHDHKVCVPRDLVEHFNWAHTVCTILIAVTAMLAAAAGTGGGGIFVPLFLLLLGLQAKEAVPLSQALIVGGAIVNVLMFSGDRHPNNPEMPKIDYKVIMMMNPGLAAGVTIGVILHRLSPQWLIVALLWITLIITFDKSMRKGVQLYQKESEQLAIASAGGPGGMGGDAGTPWTVLRQKMGSIQQFPRLAETQTLPMLMICATWFVFLALSLVQVVPCTAPWFINVGAMMLVAIAFTIGGAVLVQKGGAGPVEGALSWDAQKLMVYPFYAGVAGFLGGLVGIGGGIVMGPLLLELGMVPEANQATTAMFVFLSSTLATIQFLLLGAHMPQYVLWFTSWVIAATFLGQTLIEYLLKRYKRASIIVLSIAIVIGLSAVLMGIIGFYDVYTDIMSGAPMGFTIHKLCGAGMR